MESGVLNKKLEFNSNIICRMSAQVHYDLTEDELKQELEKRKVHKDKIQNFVHVISTVSSMIELYKHRKSKSQATINQLLGCRLQNQI